MADYNSQISFVSFSYFLTERCIFVKKKRTSIIEKLKKKKLNMKIDKKENGNSNPVLKLNEISDKLTHLLSLEKTPESISHENHKGHLESTLHIAVVFTKQLIQNQITVEFSRRISTVLTHIKYGKLKPDTIAFVGGNEKKDLISGAASGYIYFRNLSSEARVDLNGLEFIIEDSGSSSYQNLLNLLKTIKKKYGEETISKCHFTFISSDYHLIRISEIYKLSRRQSILTPLYKIGSTWTYLFAAYPFCVSPDPTLAFLGRIRVLANDLTIVLVNLNGLVANNDLIARENFSRLCETNRKLRSMIRITSEPVGFLNYINGSVEIPLEQLEILEISLCSIYEIQSTLTPLVNGKSVDKRTLIQTRDLFMNTIKKIKNTIDPDRPIDNGNWYQTIHLIKNEKFGKKN
jgi:hypothetical protein